MGTEEESSERPSSDDDDDRLSSNVWTITKEQLNYYTTQFLSMQPNRRSVIPGVLAKEFFEKSRLPITELRKIWQLSDVTKDGSLSLEEFLTAMHLVVLRRNDIKLPDELPACLRPSYINNKLLVDHHNKDLYNTNIINNPTPPSGEEISSPKPVNFDFKRDLKRDPNIVAPVPVRLSPDSPCVQSSDEEVIEVKTKHGMREVVYEQLWNQEEMSTAEESVASLTLRNNNNKEMSTSDEDLDLNGPISLPANNNPVNPLGLNRKEGTPPPPPPRPKTHTRSSSLDLNKYNKKHSQPPVPPPRLPVNRGLSTDSGVSSGIGLGVGIVGVTSRNLRLTGEELLSSSGGATTSNARSYHSSIHSLKETNSVVARTINELHQEVSDALEERIALEYQLEQLKSFGE